MEYLWIVEGFVGNYECYYLLLIFIRFLVNYLIVYWIVKKRRENCIKMINLEKLDWGKVIYCEIF